MKIENNRYIEKQLSKILSLNNEFIYSNTWLQPVKLDTDNIKNNYNFIINFKLFEFISIILKSFWEFSITLAKFFLSLINRKIQDNRKANIIILSHLLNEKGINEEEDFYFGFLQKNFSKKNFKCEKYFLNHTRINSKGKNLKAILPKIDSLNIELQVIKILFKLFCFSLLSVKKLIDKQVSISVILIFILKIFSYHNQSSLRVALQLKQKIYEKNVKILFITFEGHSYEKMIRLFNPNIKIISYQNTPISPCQFSIKFFKKSLSPDIVLTKNSYYKNILIKNKSLESKIINFGNLTYKKVNPPKNKSKSNSILFIPEGTFNEVELMINFIKKNFYRLPRYKFIIRFHPIFPKRYINKYVKSLSNAENVFFSKNSIDDDLKENSFVVYRGSSLIFNSIYMGLIPIYLNYGINVDILDLLNLNKKYVIDFKKPLTYNFIKNLRFSNHYSSMIKNYFESPKYKVLFNQLINE